jgi:hypothetical protein
LQAAAATFGVAGLPQLLHAAPSAAPGKIIVGGHPWVYAATRPQNDITPILGEIFADMAWVGGPSVRSKPGYAKSRFTIPRQRSRSGKPSKARVVKLLKSIAGSSNCRPRKMSNPLIAHLAALQQL